MINLQNIIYKLSKYKNKNKLESKEIYKIKINNYNNLLLQNGGALIDEDINFKTLNENQIKEKIKGVLGKIALNQDLLGSGASGSVYLFTKDSVIKIINQDYKEEFDNNIVVNKFAALSDQFPKFYHTGFEMEIIPGCKKGITISESLESVSKKLLNNDNTLKIDNIQFTNFCKQIIMIYLTIYNIYYRTGNIILHNDFKIDNLLLREIKNPGDGMYKYIYDVNKNFFMIPLIDIEGKKYLVVLNDFGESYTYNYETKKETIKNEAKNKLLRHEVSQAAVINLDLLDDNKRLDKIKEMHTSIQRFFRLIFAPDLFNLSQSNDLDKMFFKVMKDNGSIKFDSNGNIASEVVNNIMKIYSEKNKSHINNNIII